MKLSTLVAALLVIGLSACGKKEEAIQVPAPAPQAAAPTLAPAPDAVRLPNVAAPADAAKAPDTAVPAAPAAPATGDSEKK